MFSQITDTVLGFFADLGYLGIFAMMTIESSFVPFPSEVAMIPAWALIERGEMTFLMVLFAGTLGAWCGATINYILGYYLWGPVIKKLIHSYGRYIFLNESHYLQAEKFFQEKGAITTFIGRFIPAVRQLISIPAGVFRMNFAVFSLWTILGAGIWNIILIAIGYYASDKQDMILLYIKEIVLSLLFIALLYIGYRYYKSTKK
jgi:membrane protein DedA with SNARE-associated domain